jgi:hypothetical protein
VFVADPQAVRATSIFIRDALSECSREGKEKTIRLPEQDPNKFLVYLDFCHLNEIYLRDIPELERHFIEDERDCNRDQFHRLYKCYVMGNMLKDNTFCNAIVDTWFDLRLDKSNRLSIETIEAIFENLPQGCQLQRLVACELGFGIAKEIFAGRMLSEHECYAQICIAVAEVMSPRNATLNPEHSWVHHIHPELSQIEHWDCVFEGKSVKGEYLF